MSKKSSEYWQHRFKQIEESQHNMGLQCYADIEKQYRMIQHQLETQINAWYGKFATNNGITLQEAKSMLINRQLEELKWDINQYITYGRENAVNGQWMKQLENASVRYHISRLEALKLQTQQSLEVLFDNQLDSVDRAMRNIYTSGYYHTAYEIQKGVGIAWNFATLDDKKISKVIHKPWAADGKDFSSRIWTNKTKLVNELNTTLTQNIILGRDPQKAIDEIARKMKVSKTNAGRLVMTEEAFFSSAAQKDCFKELDVEQYEIVATLDSHTSDICQNMDGQHFNMSQWEVGVTAPPFHVNCRTTTVPYFDDELDLVGERAARGEDGKTYYVPADMDYKEWMDIFIGSTVDTNKLVSKLQNNADVITRNKPPVSLQSLDNKFTESIFKTVNNAPILFQKIILNYQDRIVFAKIDAIGNSRYNSQYGIFINLNNDYMNNRGRWSTLFHEIGHNIDNIFGSPSKSNDFIENLKSDFSVFTNRYAKTYNINIDEVYKELSYGLKHASDEESHIFSDLFEALSNGKCMGSWRHAPNYWDSKERIGKEAFAHFFSASVTNNKIKLESIKSIFPSAYKEFLRIVGDMK